MAPRREGPGDVIAAALRLEAPDITDGRGPWRGLQLRCRECGRMGLSVLEDRLCEGCRADAEFKYTGRYETLADRERKFCEKMAALERRCGNTSAAEQYELRAKR